MILELALLRIYCDKAEPVNQPHFAAWSPAVDQSYGYAYWGQQCNGCASSGLNVFDKLSGELAFKIVDPQFVENGRQLEPAVVGSGNSVLVVSGTGGVNSVLTRYDIGLQTITWQKPGNYRGHIALANGTIYTTNPVLKHIEVHSESTGDSLWSWQPPGNEEVGFGGLIVTDNLVFLSTNKRVYAISLETHQPVWSYWKPGSISMSTNGVLYIASSDGRLGAVNLQ